MAASPRAPGGAVETAPLPRPLCAPVSLALAALPFAPRRLVSKKKRRLRDAEAGVDLDLSYVTERLIAMGFPSTGLEAAWRNPAGAVARFLAAKHGAEG
jgi:hypothetical protein